MSARQSSDAAEEVAVGVQEAHRALRACSPRARRYHSVLSTSHKLQSLLSYSINDGIGNRNTEACDSLVWQSDTGQFDERNYSDLDTPQ